MINPTNCRDLLTTGSFSILYWLRIFFAFLRSVPSGAVIRFSLVITSLTFRLLSVSNLISRLVNMPTSFLFLSTTGIPPILLSFISFSASPIVASLSSVIGSIIKPLSLRFTFLTCSTCFSMLMFLCRIPTPPSRASAIARFASVTVSIAADIMGTFSAICLVSWVRMFTSRGNTCENAGTRSTSSNVTPSPKNLFESGEIDFEALILVAMCKDRVVGNISQNEIFPYWSHNV